MTSLSSRGFARIPNSSDGGELRAFRASMAGNDTRRFLHCRATNQSANRLAGIFGSMTNPRRTVTEFAGGHALYLSPTEWLLAAPDNSTVEYVELETEQDVGHCSVVEFSSAVYSFTLRGNIVTDLLSAGCPRAFEEGAFPANSATRSLLGQAHAIFVRWSVDEFEVIVARSIRTYATDWLESTADALERLHAARSNE